MVGKKVLYFAHGKESGPWGSKIQHLAKVAQSLGYQVESPDYTGMSQTEERVRKLIELKPTARESLVLVGSSMGGLVSILASRQLQLQGLFLLAPAVDLEELSSAVTPAPQAQHIEVIHGWQDEVVPVRNVLQYCKKYQLVLHLLQSGHRMNEQIPRLESLFHSFLAQLQPITKINDPRSEWEKEQESKFQLGTFEQQKPRIPR